jgi:hypothetical protein
MAGKNVIPNGMANCPVRLPEKGAVRMIEPREP